MLNTAARMEGEAIGKATAERAAKREALLAAEQLTAALTEATQE
eukprot:SAG31_NODE_32907_length_350_cov_0.872510_1_plen_43_part_10